MLRREGLRKFAARAGSAGLVASLLAASAAGGSLPTGGMLLPKPKGPSRNDLPSNTAINVYRVPSAAAYGISDVNKSFSGRDFSTIAAAEKAKRSARPAEATPVHVAAVTEFMQPVEIAEATPVQIRPRPTQNVMVSDFSPLERADDPQLQRNPLDDATTVQPATFTDLRPAEAKQNVMLDREEARIFAGLKGICPVTLIEERRVVTPRAELFTIANGCRFEFATPEAKSLFDTEPERYVPALGGRDSVLTAAGEQNAVGTLKHAGIYRERLFLFQTAETCRAFYVNPRAFTSVH
jgi:hypothetical protein